MTPTPTPAPTPPTPAPTPPTPPTPAPTPPTPAPAPAPTTTTTTNIYKIEQIIDINTSRCSSYGTGWIGESFPGLGTLCTRQPSYGCGVINISTNGEYTAVTGFITAYSRGSPDGFSSYAYPVVGDGVSIWSGDILIWDYVVGYFNFSGPWQCPANGGTLPSGQASERFYCSPTATSPSDVTIVGPLFGPSFHIGGSAAGITVPLTSADIQIRICDTWLA